MDFSTILASFLRPFLALSYRDNNINNDGSSILSLSPSWSGRSRNLVTFDRVLGAAATLSISIAVYRLLSAAIKRRTEKPDYYSAQFLHSFVKILVRGLLFSSSHNKIDQDDEADLNEAKTKGSRKKQQHRGLCHCRSVSFTLRAQSIATAAQNCCRSKICYPHYVTTAENFQLTTGAEFISVYYVHVPCGGDDSDLSTETPNDLESAAASTATVVAAHAFCSRCGVHILRAPDSSSDILELNMNCIDDDSFSENDDNDQTHQSKKTEGIHLRGARGMGAGHAIMDQWNKADNSENDKNDGGAINEIGKRRGQLHTQLHKFTWILPAAATSPTPWWGRSGDIAKEAPPDTPTTSATNESDSVLLATMSPIPSRHSLVLEGPKRKRNPSSIHSSDDSSSKDTVGSTASSSVSDGLNVGHWALRPPDRSNDITQPTPSICNSNNSAFILGPSLNANLRAGELRGTTAATPLVMKDQLKYYMKRHLSAPTSTNNSIPPSLV